MTQHTQPVHPSRPTLVVGATGKTGRHVTRLLGDAGVPVRGVSRATGFHWERPETWDAALAGARAAYVTFVPDLAVPGADDAVRELAVRARRAGVEHLVLLAGRGEAGAEAAEEAMKAAGVPWTVLRASFFTQNFTEDLFAPAVAAGELALPAGDVPEPFVDTRDIAEVAVRVLTEPGHAGRTYELTGPELHTFADVAARITAAGHPVVFRSVTADGFRAESVAVGIPGEVADLLAAIMDEVLDGRGARLGTGVPDVLGRPARSLRDAVGQAVADGVWSGVPAAG